MQNVEVVPKLFVAESDTGSLVTDVAEQTEAITGSIGVTCDGEASKELNSSLICGKISDENHS